MRSNVLKPASLLCTSFLVTFCLLAGTTRSWCAEAKRGKAVVTEKAASTKGSKPPGGTTAKSSDQSPIKNWNPYLDVAYELTYWDKAEIKEWREKRDLEIGETLAAYRTSWTGKLAGTADGGTPPRKEGEQAVFRDRDYLRLAIAHTIDYLQSDSVESLNSADQILEKLKGKSSMPEIAYWIGYVKALQALEKNDSALFSAQVYNIWNNAVLYFEQSEVTRPVSAQGGSTLATYYYRNLVNLVATRAIISRKMEELNVLGPLFLMLKERNLGDKDGEGKYFTTLVQRIAEGLKAPDSDRYRLNFTVAVIESKRLQQVTTAKLDAEGMSLAAQKTFEQAKQFNDLALKWAESRRSSGVVSVTADQLDITSFAIQRLPENEKAPAYKFFATLPEQVGSTTLLESMAVFNDLAPKSEKDWDKAGYENRSLYVKAVHRLWRATMELSLWTGDYYLAKLNSPGATQNILNAAKPVQNVLESYLDFLGAQNSRGFKDVVPDSAIFGAAEAAEKLAYAYYKVNMYSLDDKAYNRWLFNRLQATELFPLVPREVTQTAAVLRQDGRYNLYLDYFQPLAGRVNRSPAIKKWINSQKTEDIASIRDYVGAIDQIFASAPASAADATTKSADGSSYTVPFQQLREEMQRKPDHPVHQLLKEFYLEEMQKKTPYTRLLKDPKLLDLGL
jgi:hypothetical protein